MASISCGTIEKIFYVHPQQHYDPNLQHRLPANNNGNPVVLNHYFKGWEEHITANLKCRIATGGQRYEQGKDNKLLQICRKHADKYRGVIEHENIVVLVHPFYLHLSEMSHLTNLTIGDADDYLNRAMDVLEGGIPKENASIVVLDTIHHYAATTSLLLEEKTIDQVRFTEYDQGYLVDSSELNQIKGKNLFFAGAYNKKCLSQSIVEILNKKHPMEKLWIIRDLVLDSPGQRIRTLKVIGRTDTGQYDIPRKNAITLEEAIRKIEDCA